MLRELGHYSTIEYLVWIQKICRPRSLVLLSSSQSLGSTTQSVSVVSSELGVNVSQRSVSVSLWLLDTVLVSLLGLVVGGVVLRLGHFAGMLVTSLGWHWAMKGKSSVKVQVKVGSPSRFNATNYMYFGRRDSSD